MLQCLLKFYHTCTDVSSTTFLQTFTADSLFVIYFYVCAFVKVRKLKRELDAAHEKISTLTAQLSTNVSLFPLLNIHTMCACEEILTTISPSNLRQTTRECVYLRLSLRSGCLIHNGI